MKKFWKLKLLSTELMFITKIFQNFEYQKEFKVSH
jgi:hypothetical protein